MKQTLEEAAKENILFNHRTVDRTLSGGNLAQFGITNFIQGAEWQAKQSPWISVKDRLPQTDDDLYIVLDARMNPPGCGVCDFNPKTKTWIDYDCNIVHPTHWMPIPPFDEILEANRDILERIKEKEVSHG